MYEYPICKKCKRKRVAGNWQGSDESFTKKIEKILENNDGDLFTEEGLRFEIFDTCPECATEEGIEKEILEQLNEDYEI